MELPGNRSEEIPEGLGFEASLVFSDDPDLLLSIRNNERVNRSLATQEQIRKTSYCAYVRHVQYGLYQQRPACVVGIDFAFRFPLRSSGRFSSAEVEVTFENALDRKKPALRSTDASLDPVVANFAPKHMIGEVRQREDTRSFDVAVPIVFEAPFASAGVTATWPRGSTVTEEGRMEIHGNLAQDDDHDEGANSVTWDLTENHVSKAGIFRSFRGVVVLFCRPEDAFWMRVSVKPVVKFSLDPRRLLTKRMMGDRDDPVFLDGEVMVGSPRA